MILRKELENTGGWLFRWRSYIPIAVIGIFLYAMREYEYPWHNEALDVYWEAVCLTVSLVGLGIRILTIGHTPKGTSGRTTKKQVAKSLNTTGVYSVVRNPLYLGNFFMGLGISMFAHIWWLTLVYVLIFWIYYERIILAEEAFLIERFGDEYIEWANITPVFIPNLRLYRKAALPFSLRNVLGREYNGLFALIVVMFLLETVGDLRIEGRFDLDMGWLIILCFGLAEWLTLWSLKKYTRVLHVEGR